MQAKQQLLLFKYKRPANEQPIQEIGIYQQPRKHIKSDLKYLQKCFSHFGMHQTPKFLLAKVNPEQIQSTTSKIQNSIILEKIYDKQMQRRNEVRESIFNAVRGIKTEGVKVIDIVDEDFVDFGGKKIINIMPMREDYYILQRNGQNKQIPCISMPEQLIDIMQNNDEPGVIEKEDSEDSNREDQPDYDYPQQDYHGSNSSQGVIDGSQELEDEEVDEEQLYRRYLRRCKQSKDDDQFDIYQEC